MLTQQTNEIEASGDGGRQPVPRRREKRPTAFMFIDSSNGGINAKPDRVVRSFVMKSARNRKPWSTRPKSPKIETSTSARPRRRSSSGSQTSDGQNQIIGCSPRLECNIYKAPWKRQSVTSLSSSRSNSVFSNYSSHWACESPVSTYTTSPCAEYDYSEDVSDFLSSRQIALSRPRNFNGRFTPFDCLAVRLDTDAKRLLHQFVEVSTPRLLPVDPHKSSEAAATDWVATCIQSPIGAPFIYAALTSSARAARLDAEVYKWRAIAEVNRILTDPTKSTDDTTIATVLMLLAMEEADLADPQRQGDERRYSKSVNEAHQNGLRTMIGQRGGLAALGENRCLQVFILFLISSPKGLFRSIVLIHAVDSPVRHSVAQSIATFKRPYAILLDRNGHIEDYTSISFQSPQSFAGVLRPFHELGIDRGLFEIISTATIFISDLTVWYEAGTSPIDAIDLQKHASLLMYRLFDWYEGSSLEHPFDQSIDQSICLATLIFMVTATEPNTISFGLRLHKAVSKLCAALEKAPILQWSNAPDLLLWVLTMGALGSSTLPKSSRPKSHAEPRISFFTEYSRAAFSDRGSSGACADLEALLAKMRAGLWIRSIFDERVKRLWVSMGMCKAEAVEIEDRSSSESEGDQVIDEESALGKSTMMRFFPADARKAGRRTGSG
ncbi:hypothetical protein BKA66DRAFT_442215 [Pyrenochaeta sp. MPI-SDFR-AT-0127]|nr:hypothetical protein BKA66DRAFT_442215 [Pyrenochaeta sp. MPI-SDFR-AT-0127]